MNQCLYTKLSLLTLAHQVSESLACWSVMTFWAAGPEEDINIAEGQFVHSEELWSSNGITATSTVLKNKNESQASS